MEENKEELMREAREQVEQNLFLQRIITIISNNPLYNKDENDDITEPTYDYNALLEDYKAEAVKNNRKFISLGEPDERQIEYYYNLFQLGYRTFGAEFFKQMCMNETNCVQMFIGLWSLVCGLESLSDTLAQKDVELAAYKALKLNPEQKEILAEGLNKTPQQLMEEMWTKALDLDDEEGDK